MRTWEATVPDDAQLELQAAQRKIEELERKVRLLQEGLHQAERLRQMFDLTAKELEAAKAQLLRQSGVLEEKVRERTRQLVEAQEELVRREKLAVLGQVAGSVGHELRNPLGVMNNAVYFLQTVLSDADETTREYLDILKNEIAASERIVSDLLDSVRTKPPQTQTVCVAELVGQGLEKCVIPSAIIVIQDIPEGIIPIKADPLQMQQVLRNLITNAIEAMPEGGVLQIHASEDRRAGRVTLSVQDSGEGISPENRAHLFQPLFTTKARGIGLGLVVVKNLTAANGGQVEVLSEVGKGTTFSVILPGDYPVKGSP